MPNLNNILKNLLQSETTASRSLPNGLHLVVNPPNKHGTIRLTAYRVGRYPSPTELRTLLNSLQAIANGRHVDKFRHLDPIDNNHAAVTYVHAHISQPSLFGDDQ